MQRKVNRAGSRNPLRGPSMADCAAICLAFLQVRRRRKKSAPEWLPDLLEKERVTIVVTDSGLGGLSVLADAAEKFRQYPVFKAVDLVFVNALFRDAGWLQQPADTRGKTGRIQQRPAKHAGPLSA